MIKVETEGSVWARDDVVSVLQQSTILWNWPLCDSLLFSGTHKVAVNLLGPDTFITEVYDPLGYLWKRLARELGFNMADITSLEHDHAFSVKEQIYQMFLHWKRREGDGATTEKLLSAKKAAGFSTQIKTVKERLRSEYKPVLLWLS